MLPKALCSNINSLMQKFWWGEARIPRMSWSKMGASKAKGAIGFQDFKCFNKALLSKQCWPLWHTPDSLASKIMKAKYYASSSIQEAKLGNKSSFAWRSILGSSELLKKGLFWRIGNGEKMRIWGDKWIQILATFSIQSPPRLLDLDAIVSELIDRDTQWWNKGLIEALFLPTEVKAILSIPLSSTNQADVLMWRGMAKGVLTIRSAYL